MLASLNHQAWRSGDRVLVVHDGIASDKTRELCRDIRLIELPEGPHKDYGHTPRNKVMPLIKEGYICHLDDDDTLATDAIAAMHAQIDKSPGSIFLFRMRDAAGKLYWSNKTQIMSNVGTGCVLHPATIDLAEFDSSRYDGDGVFVEETIRRNPETPVVWVDRVTYLIRPTKLRIACICPSYRRPDCLRTTLAQFQAQVLETCEAHLFILEDSGLWEFQHGDRWTFFAESSRYETFGIKFNKLCLNAKREGYDAAVIFEDDDIYLPGHVEAHAKVLASHRYSVPSRKVVDCHRKHPIGLLEWSDLREETNPLPTGLHGSWAFWLDIWEAVGGYPEEAMDGFDLEFGRRLMEAGGANPGDYCEFTTPQYGYRWSSAPGKNCRNASAYSSSGQLYYDRAAEQGDATDQHGVTLTPFMDAGALEFSRLMRDHYEPKAMPATPVTNDDVDDFLQLSPWIEGLKQSITSGRFALFAAGINPDGTASVHSHIDGNFPNDMKVPVIKLIRDEMAKKKTS